MAQRRTQVADEWETISGGFDEWETISGPNAAIKAQQAAKYPTATTPGQAVEASSMLPPVVGSVLSKAGSLIAEEGPAMAGGAVGAGLGVPLGPAGIATGAVFGGAAGEAVKQLYNRVTGRPSPQTGAEAVQGLSAGAATGLGQTIGAIGGPRVAQAVAGRMKGQAVKGMSQVLGATTNENKAITQRVVPKLLQRRVMALTEKGLAKKAQSGIESAGDALEAAIAAVPGTKTVDTSPILRAMSKYKDEFKVAGSKVIGDERGSAMAQAQIDKMMELVGQQGTDVSFKSLRSLRQILDKSVKAGKGFGGKTVTEGTELDAKRELAGAIRSELAKAEPNIARINAEYSFWKNVDQVISAKITRQLPQSKALGEQLLTGAGVAGGMARGGAAGAVSAGLATKAMVSALRSTAWKTVSANAKNVVADLLASGQVEAAAKVAGAITGVAAARAMSK